MLIRVTQIILGLLFLSQSFLLSANDSEKLYSESLPPVTAYQLQSSVMELVELNFFLHKPSSNLPGSEKKASKRYRKLKKFYEKNIDQIDKLALGKVKSRFNQAIKLYQYYAVRNISDIHSQKISFLRTMIYKTGEWIYFKEEKQKSKNETRVLYLAAGLNQASYVSDVLPQLTQSLENSPRRFVSSLHLLVYYQLKSSQNSQENIQQLLSKKNFKWDKFERQLIRLIDIDRELELLGEIRTLKEKQSVYDRLYNISLSAQKIKINSVVWLINQSILYLWSKVNSSMDWRVAPLFEIKNNTSSLLPAVRERMALENVKEGKILPAMSAYKQLSGVYHGQVLGLKLDLRYLHLAHLYSLKTGQKKDLAQVHQGLAQKYTKPIHSIKKLSKTMKRRIFLSYRRMIEGELFDAIDGENVSTPDPNMTSFLVEGFLRTYPKNSKTRTVKSRLAEFYIKHSNYQRALPLYMSLAEKEPLEYYPLAIRTQKKLALWPEQAPWSVQVTAQKNAERKDLARIYERFIDAKAKLKESVSWEEISHLGLLYQYQGKPTNMEKLWTPYIVQGGAGPDINNAIGLVLAYQFKQKRWSDFITLTRQGENLKLIPSLGSKVMDIRTFYRIAMSYRADKYVKEKNYEKAEKDYEDLVSRYKDATYGPNFLFALAKVKQLREQVIEAKKYVLQLIRLYPSHTIIRGAIITAAGWSGRGKKKDLLEANEGLYAFYMAQFPQDSKFSYIRYERSKVLISLKRFKLASKLLYDHAIDPKAPLKERVRSALTHINLETRYGESGPAIADLLPIVRQVKISFGEENFVLGHVILAKSATERFAVNEMKREEIILKPYIEKYQDAAEAVGMIRFNLIELAKHQIPFYNGKYDVGKFRPQINQIIEKFQFIKKEYESVCLSGYNQHCVNAYDRLRHFAQDAIDAVAAVELRGPTQTKIKSVLKDFQAEKMSELDEEKERIEELAEKYRVKNESVK